MAWHWGYARTRLVFLRVDEPEVCGLPPDPKWLCMNLVPASMFSALSAFLVALIDLIGRREEPSVSRSAHSETRAVPSSR